MQIDEKFYLTELGKTDKEENTVPAEDRDWGEISVGPDTVAQVRHGQHQPDHQAEQGGGVRHQQTCTHEDVGHHVNCGQWRCVWCQHGVSCQTELSSAAQSLHYIYMTSHVVTAWVRPTSYCADWLKLTSENKFTAWTEKYEKYDSSQRQMMQSQILILCH